MTHSLHHSLTAVSHSFPHSLTIHSFCSLKLPPEVCRATSSLCLPASLLSSLFLPSLPFPIYCSLKFFLSLYGHKLPATTLDISSDSTILISGSADKNIKVGLWGGGGGGAGCVCVWGGGMQPKCWGRLLCLRLFAFETCMHTAGMWAEHTLHPMTRTSNMLCCVVLCCAVSRCGALISVTVTRAYLPTKTQCGQWASYGTRTTHSGEKRGGGEENGCSLKFPFFWAFVVCRN